jgi:2-polyprenyl-3-methyl-5-hydroxy-6-metoxy-1,4-benzoquinol methylase
MMSRSKPSRGPVAEEANFHDRHFRGEHPATGRLERWIVSLSPPIPNLKGRLLMALGQVNGKHICEIGCGGGGLTRELATRGARVSALDISAEALSLTRERNKEFIPKQVDVQQMDASNLLFNDESFDLVIGVSILHHIDINKAAVEVSRVLKPGGKAVFIEPLAHNPISNMWRRLSPSARTPDELPLSYYEISEMGKRFSSVNCREFALLTLLSSFVYLITHSQKAKIKSAELLDRLEPSFLKVCKPLRRYSGAILIEFTR